LRAGACGQGAQVAFPALELVGQMPALCGRGGSMPFQALVASTGLKDRPFGKNRMGMNETLGHLFEGGQRRRKAIEGWLQRAGYISAGEYVVPGEGARIDSYGNMSRGQVQQILSQLRAGPDSSAYATRSLRSKRAQRAAKLMFWSRGGRLPRGVWARDGVGLKPILIVVGRAGYYRRINLERITRRVVGVEYQKRFAAEYAKALRTAR
jgi:hypothetical protein